MKRDEAKDPIAIVGVGCRLPGGVKSAAQLAGFLERHGDGVIEVPADRFSTDLHHDPNDGPGKIYVKHGGFLTEDLFSFDPAPFGISPREADHLDPQQRLLLETSFEAFEDAGMQLDALRGSKTGVFVGGFTLDAQALALHPEGRHLVGPHTSTGATMTVLSNRLSYTYDLRGPSLTVDTACSSSLVATHLACRALDDGSCDLALVGGVNAILSPAFTLIMCKGHFLAPDGRSKAFDAAGDGYGRGEGAVVLLLERLSRARALGHDVLAVILATAVNQDGRTDGMPMPNGDAQAALASEACTLAGVRPSDVAYVEAHGTGTRAGDPIEARALASVYGQGRAADQPLRIGSIKSNVGHLEAGAGVLGLLKAALCVRDRRILPQRRLTAPNPEIAFDALKLRVAQEAEPWPVAGRAIAALNSFGYGGTNAHVLVAEAPQPDRARAVVARPTLYPISAETPAALAARAAALRTVSASDADLGYTLARRRAHLAERAVVRATDQATLRDCLEALAKGEQHPAVSRGRASARRRVLWVYTGMGPQHAGMGRVLHESDAVFRATAARIDAVFERLGGRSVLALMLEGDPRTMARNDVAQPANFLLQASLTEALRARGVTADAYLGHSVGEVSAAWASGALDLEQASTVAFHRAMIQQQVAGRGSMLAVGATADEALARVAPGSDVVVAAYNAPRSVALAGAASELDAIAARCEQDGIFARRMRVEVAYHSQQMMPLEGLFYERLGFVRPERPRATLYSTTLGARVDGACHDAEYWWRNARQPVLLQRALEAALDDGHDAFIEIGPHPVLGAAIGEVARVRNASIAMIATLRRDHDDVARVDAAIADLHVAGAPVEWSAIAPDGAHVSLPTYPFQRERHWVEAPRAAEDRLGRVGAHPLLQRHGGGAALSFRSDLGTRPLRYLEQHRVDGVALMPGAAYVEAMLAIATERYGEDVELVLDDVRFERPLALVYDAPLSLETSLDDDLVRVRSVDAHGGVTEHARGRIESGARYRSPARVDRDALAARLEPVDVRELYERLAALALEYGDAFQTIKELRVREGEVLARIVAGAEDARSILHPTALDGALQALLATGDLASAAVPIAIARVRVCKAARGDVFVHGRARLDDADVIGDLVVFDETGDVVAELAGVRCRPLRRAGSEPTAEERRWHHVERFVPLDPPASSSAHVVELSDPDDVDVVADVVAIALTSDPRDPAGTDAVTRLARALRAVARRPEPPRVRVVTRGAYAALGSESVDPVQAALAGLARVAQTESPSLRVRVVDLDGSDTPELRRALLADEREEEVALRMGALLARRIERAPIEQMGRNDARVAIEPGSGRAFELVASRPGDLGSLEWRPAERRAPVGDEIEVAIETASLNFKDVLKALGLLSPTALEGTYLGTRLGMEAVGHVLRAGPRVTHVSPGDRVHVYNGGVLASHAIVRAPFVARCDADQDPVDAASWFVIATAWYGLAHAARVRRGERVLIHSAAGGVGLAAVYAARHLGAEIFATAGTEAKRELLRRAGVRNVYDSRTLDFADEILRDTEGRGVHVVLNALAGAAQRRSLEVLSTGGRFVELGKQDIAGGGSLALLPFNRALSFHAVDLDRLASADESYFAPLLQEVIALRRSGAIPPLPREVFGPDDVEAAFRRLSSGALIGKAVVDLRARAVHVAPGIAPGARIRSDRAYLVTGGLGGFGLRTARWLVERGARHVWLASRRGAAASAADERALATLRKRAAVHAIALDVSDVRAVREAIARIDESGSPLAGIFHSAMVLDDRQLSEMGPGDIARVLHPKALGAWNLHEATRDRTADRAIELFVMYSSVASLVGNPGQGAYAAANAYLDGLAERRRAEGLAATSVSWGAIGEVGVVARDRATEAHLATMGLSPLPPDRALAVLGAVLGEGRRRPGIIDIDWDRWRRATAPTPWQRLLGLSEEPDGAGDGPIERLRAELADRDPTTRADYVAEVLAAAAASVFRLPVERLDVDRPLRDMGLDSLMAVELQLSLERATGIELTTMELLAGKALRSFVDRVLARIDTVSESKASPGDPVAASPDLRARLLATICVQPPYFALEALRREGEWLAAEARPAAAPDVEAGAVGVAEAARHLAILGSCAVREALGGEGRVYFPVRGARMLEGRSAHDRARRVTVRARALEIDRRKSVARAMTELFDESGARLAQFEMVYHVIDESSFRTLFAAHARPTNEARARDPYQNVRPIPAVRRDGDRWIAALDPVTADECLGHFVGYPAYPVSIMARDAVQLVGAALRDVRGRAARFAVTGGEAGTERFVFAGQARRLVAERRGEHLWRTRIECGGETAAFFDMAIDELD